MKKKFSEIAMDIFLSRQTFPKEISLFLITKDGFIRIYNGKSYVELDLTKEYGKVERLKCERGDILDFFAKLEFFVNEMIQIKLLGPSAGEKRIMLDDVLENVNFFSRIKLLRKWNIIDKRLHKLLMKIKSVRNGLAHVWDIKEINYEKVSLENNFHKFKEDITLVWANLIDSYKKEQEKIDLKPIYDLIEEF